jgi:arabinofuranan 3-O-arabinosyltransferase
MGIGTPWTRQGAGLAYALSPVGLTLLGQTSGEFLQMVMLPWILLPLTDMRPWATAVQVGPDGLTQQRPGKRMRARAVARSAVAVALCSGMNAASAAAVLLPAVIYILTRPGTGPAVRTKMLAWWVPAVVLVTASWSVPLVLLFKYGVSIVPFTESAQVTASSTSLLNIFRGTEDWVGYLVVNGQDWRPLAFQIATDLVPALLLGGRRGRPDPPRPPRAALPPVVRAARRRDHLARLREQPWRAA